MSSRINHEKRAAQDKVRAHGGERIKTEAERIAEVRGTGGRPGAPLRGGTSDTRFPCGNCDERFPPEASRDVHRAQRHPPTPKRRKGDVHPHAEVLQGTPQDQRLRAAAEAVLRTAHLPLEALVDELSGGACADLGAGPMERRLRALVALRTFVVDEKGRLSVPPRPEDERTPATAPTPVWR